MPSSSSARLNCSSRVELLRSLCASLDSQSRIKGRLPYVITQAVGVVGRETNSTAASSRSSAVDGGLPLVTSEARCPRRG